MSKFAGTETGEREFRRPEFAGQNSPARIRRPEFAGQPRHTSSRRRPRENRVLAKKVPARSGVRIEGTPIYEIPMLIRLREAHRGRFPDRHRGMHAIFA
jgi:hypothetical protein